MLTPLPDPSLPWPIAMPAVALCAEKESLRLKVYQCEAGKWTIGWGETVGVGPNTPDWTKAYADKRFCDELTQITAEVSALLTNGASQNELGAMVVLVYNIGIPEFRTSSVLRAHNAGDKNAAARSFLLFDKYRDKKTGMLVVSNGLVIRRHQESAMYLTPDVGSEAPPSQMPQAVMSEDPLIKSPTLLTGWGVGGAGGLGVLQEFSGQARDVIDQIRGFCDSVGLSLPVVIAACALVAGAVIVYRRMQQRKLGKA